LLNDNGPGGPLTSRCTLLGQITVRRPLTPSTHPGWRPSAIRLSFPIRATLCPPHKAATRTSRSSHTSNTSSTTRLAPRCPNRSLDITSSRRHAGLSSGFLYTLVAIVKHLPVDATILSAQLSFTQQQPIPTPDVDLRRRYIQDILDPTNGTRTPRVATRRPSHHPTSKLPPKSSTTAQERCQTMPEVKITSAPSPKRPFSAIKDDNPRRPHPTQSKSLVKNKKPRLEQSSDGSEEHQALSGDQASPNFQQHNSRDSSSDQSAAKWFASRNENVEASQGKRKPRESTHAACMSSFQVADLPQMSRLSIWRNNKRLTLPRIFVRHMAAVSANVLEMKPKTTSCVV
jgi:hypothetical protein